MLTRKFQPLPGNDNATSRVVGAVTPAGSGPADVPSSAESDVAASVFYIAHGAKLTVVNGAITAAAWQKFVRGIKS